MPVDMACKGTALPGAPVLVRTCLNTVIIVWCSWFSMHIIILAQWPLLPSTMAAASPPADKAERRTRRNRVHCNYLSVPKVLLETTMFALGFQSWSRYNSFGGMFS